jgi:peptidoglycan/LPS O-acetylase OafA/YrhL
MARVGPTRRSHRAELRNFARSASVPRWILIPLTLILGLVLWLAVVSDSSGRFSAPGAGAIVYTLAVIGVVGWLAYHDREEGSSAGCGKRDSMHERRRCT